MEPAIMRLTLLGGNCWVGLDKEHPAWRLTPPGAFWDLRYVVPAAGRQEMKHDCLPNQSKCSILWKVRRRLLPLWKSLLKMSSTSKCVDLGNVGSSHIDLVTMLWDNLDKQRTCSQISGHKSLLYFLVNEIHMRINQVCNAHHRCQV